MALLDVQVAMLANLSSTYFVSGEAPARMGNAHQNIVPYHVFRAADEFLIVAVGNDSQFAKFCEVIGAPEWTADPRFATNPQRVRHRDLLVGMISERMRARRAREWLAAPRAFRRALRADQRPFPGVRRSAGVASRHAGDRPASGGR